MSVYTVSHRHGAPEVVEAVNKMSACEAVARKLYGTPILGEEWTEWELVDFRDMMVVDGVIYDITCWAYDAGPHKGQIYFKAWPWDQRPFNGSTGLKLVADLLAKGEAIS